MKFQKCLINVYIDFDEHGLHIKTADNDNDNWEKSAETKGSNYFWSILVQIRKIFHFVRSWGQTIFTEMKKKNLNINWNF